MGQSESTPSQSSQRASLPPQVSPQLRDGGRAATLQSRQRAKPTACRPATIRPRTAGDANAARAAASQHRYVQSVGHRPVNDGDRSHFCLLCNVSFSTQHLLHEHLRLDHDFTASRRARKPVSRNAGDQGFCSVCKRSFGTKLENHLQHAALHKYPQRSSPASNSAAHRPELWCDICQLSFTHSDRKHKHTEEMNTHMHLERLNTDNMPSETRPRSSSNPSARVTITIAPAEDIHYCRPCDRYFSTARDLELHETSRECENTVGPQANGRGGQRPSSAVLPSSNTQPRVIQAALPRIIQDATPTPSRVLPRPTVSSRPSHLPARPTASTSNHPPPRSPVSTPGPSSSRAPVVHPVVRLSNPEDDDPSIPPPPYESVSPLPVEDTPSPSRTQLLSPPPFPSPSPSTPSASSPSTRPPLSAQRSVRQLRESVPDLPLTPSRTRRRPPPPPPPPPAKDLRSSRSTPNLQPARPAFECALCLEHDTDVSALACGHIFGTACIRDALRDDSRCPLCREHSKISDLRKIFLT